MPLIRFQTFIERATWSAWCQLQTKSATIFCSSSVFRSADPVSSICYREAPSSRKIFSILRRVLTPPWIVAKPRMYCVSGAPPKSGVASISASVNCTTSSTASR